MHGTAHSGAVPSRFDAGMPVATREGMEPVDLHQTTDTTGRSALSALPALPGHEAAAPLHAAALVELPGRVTADQIQDAERFAAEMRSGLQAFLKANPAFLHALDDD